MKMYVRISVNHGILLRVAEEKRMTVSSDVVGMEHPECPHVVAGRIKLQKIVLTASQKS